MVQEIDKKAPINMAFELTGGKNSVIPKGEKEKLNIVVYEQKATFQFNNAETTRKFSIRQSKDGVRSIYDSPLNLCICIYPKMSKLMIKSHILNRFKALGVKRK